MNKNVASHLHVVKESANRTTFRGAGLPLLTQVSFSLPPRAFAKLLYHRWETTQVYMLYMYTLNAKRICFRGIANVSTKLNFVNLPASALHKFYACVTNYMLRR